MSDASKTASVRILDPKSTAAVVLGAHDWSEAGLGRSPSFLRSARGVVRYLYDPAGLGLEPELVLDLFDDTAAAGDQLARLRDTLDVQLRDRKNAGRPVTDILLYYVGHGYTDDQGQLCLLIRRSRQGLEAETSIKAADLARALRRAAPKQRRAVVLDCCFSEAAAKAFIGMGDLNQQVAATALHDLGDDQPVRGTLLLCSSPVGRVSIGPANADRTLFTGAVLDVLYGGSKRRSGHLSFADLRDEAFEIMLNTFGVNTPRPALHQVNAEFGDLTRAPAFLNRSSKVAPAKKRSRRPEMIRGIAAQRSENKEELANGDHQRLHIAPKLAQKKEANKGEAHQRELEERRQPAVQAGQTAQRAQHEAKDERREEDRQGQPQAESTSVSKNELDGAYSDEDIYELSNGELACVFSLTRPGLAGLNKLAKSLNSLLDEHKIAGWHMHGWQDQNTKSKAVIRFPRPMDGIQARARWKIDSH